MRTLSAETLSEFFKPQTGIAVLTILKLIHSSFDTIYVVDNTVEIEYDGIIYQPFAFRFTTPEQAEGTMQPSKFIIDNVNQEIVRAVRLANSPITVMAATIVVNTDGEVSKEAGWWTMKLRNVTYDVMKVSGDLVMGKSLTNNISKFTYNNLDFPGLYG